MDSEGKVTYLGVIRDVCSADDWDRIYEEIARKKAEAEAAPAAEEAADRAKDDSTNGGDENIVVPFVPDKDIDGSNVVNDDKDTSNQDSGAANPVDTQKEDEADEISEEDQ